MPAVSQFGDIFPEDCFSFLPTVKYGEILCGGHIRPSVFRLRRSNSFSAVYDIFLKFGIGVHDKNL